MMKRSVQEPSAPSTAPASLKPLEQLYSAAHYFWKYDEGDWWYLRAGQGGSQVYKAMRCILNPPLNKSCAEPVQTAYDFVVGRYEGGIDDKLLRIDPASKIITRLIELPNHVTIYHLSISGIPKVSDLSQVPNLSELDYYIEGYVTERNLDSRWRRLAKDKDTSGALRRAHRARMKTHLGRYEGDELLELLKEALPVLRDASMDESYTAY